jgi:hypothetical protein
VNNPSKPHRAIYAITGLVLLVYGLKSILAREISIAGAGLHGVGWSIQGEPAMLIGFLLGLAGACLLSLAFRL